MGTNPQCPGAIVGAGGDSGYRHPPSLPVIDVCPHCKRHLTFIDGPRGVCEEHGSVVAVRSAVVKKCGGE